MIIMMAMLLGMLGWAPSAAAVQDLGVLPIGSQTTLDAAVVGETYQYAADIPAGKRLTFQVAPGAGTAQTNLAVRVNGVLAAATGFGNTRQGPGAGFLDVQTAPVDRSVTVSFLVSSAGSLPFTASLMDDPAPVPLALGGTVKAAITVPGQQLTYTIAGVAGHRLGLSVTGSTFANATVRVTLSGAGVPRDQFLTIGGPTTPGWIMTDSTYTVRVDGVLDYLGSVDVTAQDIVDVTGPLTLGSTVTAQLGTVWTQYAWDFTQVPGAQLRLDVLSSTLQRKDGSPGGAVFSMDGFFSSTLDVAWIGPGTTLPFTSMVTQMDSTTTRHLRLRTDGLSSGTVTFRLSAQFDNPPVPATVGTPIPVSVDVSYTTRSYTVDLGSKPRFRLSLKDIALQGAAGQNSPNPVSVTAWNNGTIYGSWAVPPGSAWSEEFVPGTYPQATGSTWTFVIDPAEDLTGTATFLISPIDDVVVPITLGRTATATMNPASDTILFTHPGGSATAPSVVFEGSTLTTADGAAVPVRLVYEQGDVAVASDDLTTGPAGSTFAAPAGLDPSRPWRLRTVVGFGVTGTLSITAREPVVTQRTVSMGSSTAVRFAAAGDRTELTFTPRADRRLVIQRNSTVTLLMQLRTASGVLLAEDPGTGWIELPARGIVEPLVLVITQPPNVAQVVTSGSVTIAHVTDPAVVMSGATRISWVAGANPTATFTGKKGTRPTITITGAAWTPDQLPVDVTLRAPGGAPLGSFTVLPQNGSAFLDLPEPLASNGTYTIVWDPQGPSRGSLTATVRLITDLQRSVDLGESTTLKFAAPGQRAVLTVEVPRGRELAWTADSGDLWSSLTLVDPSGVTIGWGETPPGHGEGRFATGALAPGKYTVIVDPRSDQVGTVKLKLTAPRV